MAYTTIKTEFSYSDKINILKFVQERLRQVIKNYSTIQQKNEERKEQYANERKELTGFDFDKKLVSYKSKVSEQICKDKFWLSFGKTLCYALSAICSEYLMIIFSPLKVLIKDQKECLNTAWNLKTTMEISTNYVTYGNMYLIRSR
ncbi:hypothetical protein C1645_745300 [Glomus cerebriforme]|uniref:Uncharacterized protein n=1 Tax=Glomus cerebriforme TaxID=658196 RepID=A0A397S7R5_9GLOM|nr:hypothetical protein C1645_745300 [Glomus cerebriforme]